MRTRMRWLHLPRLAILVSLCALYLVLTQHYRAYDVDNPWFLSFSYNAAHRGLGTDTFLQVRFPGGMDGVHLFGKAAASIQAHALDHLGWTPASVVLLNTGIGFVSLAILWSALRTYGYSERWVAAYIVVLGTTEPVVSMMEKARYEYFTFLLLCLAVWLAAQGFEFGAALLSFASLETEPAAILIPLAILPLLAARTPSRKQLALKTTLAAAAAFAVYLRLHPGAIQAMLTAPPLNQRFPPGGVFRSYFVDRRRHLLDAAFLLGGLLLAWKRRRTLRQPATLLVALLSFAVLVLLHPNPAYMVLAMPFLLWPSMEGYVSAPSLRFIPVAFVLCSLASYAYLFRINRHEGFGPSEFRAIRAQITEQAAQRHLDPNSMHIAGDYSLWFAHPQDFRALGGRASLLGADLYFCFDRPLQPGGLSALSMFCPEAQQLQPMKQVSTLTVRGHLLRVFVPASATP
jgi:hypothetical protein